MWRRVMLSIIRNTIIGTMLLLFFPIAAFADVKIIINPPSYKYNPYGYKQYYPNYYSNKYRYNNNHYKKYYSKKEKYNKYNFAPYSYRSNQYKYSHGNNRYNQHHDILRPSYSRIYNYNPYASNYNPYQHQKEKVYWRGYKDALKQQRKQFKLGK